MAEKKFPRRAAKYMRGAAYSDTRRPANCPDCEGSGWTVEGWEARAPDADWRKGDCARCNGTGALQ